MGRRAEDPGVDLIGLVDLGDLEELKEPAPGPGQQLKKLKDSHHALARYLALGLPEAQISSITGKNLAYISTLKNDPAMQELIAFYRKHEGREFEDLQERIRLLGTDMLEELAARLHDPEQAAGVPFSALLEGAKMALDRSGFGPVQKNLNVNTNIGLDELARMKAKAQENEGVRTTKEVEQGSPCETIEGSAVEVGGSLEEDKAQGSGREGKDLRAESFAEAPTDAQEGGT